MKQHPILGQRTQMHTRVRSHTENTQHAHAHAHARTHTHTHTHTHTTPEAQCPRGAPGGGRASCRGPRGLLASATPSTPCALAPAVPPWCSPQLCLVCHHCMCLCHQATPYYSKPADPPWCSPQLFDLSADEPPGQPGQGRSARTRHLWVNSEGKPRLGPCSGPPR